MTDYQKEILMTTSIHLNSKECSRCKNIDGLIKYKLKKEHENLCNKHGYVLENTLKLINRSVGKIVTHDNMSMIEYNITMKIILTVITFFLSATYLISSETYITKSNVKVMKRNKPSCDRLGNVYDACQWMLKFKINNQTSTLST